MKKKLLLITCLITLVTILPHASALEEDNISIISHATTEEYDYLVNELGFDGDYINSIPRSRVEYLLEHANVVETETVYYKTYEGLKNNIGVSQTAFASDPLIGTTVELTKEEYYDELEKKQSLARSTDIDGRYETSYKHMNVSRSKIDSTTHHYVYELYWDILPSRRDIDYFSFVTNSTGVYCRNYYSAQLYSSTAGSYTSTTSVFNSNGNDNLDHVQTQGATELESAGYSLPRTARYDLVNSANAIKLIHSFDVYNLPAGKVVSAVYLHNTSGSFSTNQLGFVAATPIISGGINGGGTVNIHHVSTSSIITLSNYTRQTWMLSSL